MTTPENKTVELVESDLDSCYCGDFRRSHRLGRGPCSVHRCNCGGFRLDFGETEYKRRYPEHHTFLKSIARSALQGKEG